MLYAAPGLSQLPTNQANEARRCIVALLGVISFGTIGFILIEGWSVWKSLFFTLITITTVGYGDEGVSARGEIFAAILLIVGIATATYSFSTLMQIVVNRQVSWRREMKRQISQLRDHYIICGFGRIGKAVCQRLQAGGVPFVVIDNGPVAFQAALDQGFLAICGNSTEDDVLREAGVEQAQGVVCVVDSDAENVFIALSAHELNDKVFIASRADADGAVRKIERAGASLVVSPYATAGSRIAEAILRTQLREQPRPADDGLELCEITIAQDAPAAGQFIKALYDFSPSVSVVAVQRTTGELELNPQDDLQLSGGDHITAAGRPEDLSRLYQWASIEPEARLDVPEVSTVS